MYRLISPTARTPYSIKALIRWMIVKYHTRIRNRSFMLQTYGDGVPTWRGWIEQNGMAIAFVDNDGHYHYKW